MLQLIDSVSWKYCSFNIYICQGMLGLNMFVLNNNLYGSINAIWAAERGLSHQLLPLNDH